MMFRSPKSIDFLGYNVLPSPRTVGEYIRCARYAAGLNHLELGSLLGVSNHTISEWELDRKTPSPLQLDLIENISMGLPAPFRKSCPEHLKNLCAGAVRCDRRHQPRSTYPSEPSSLGDHIRRQRLEAGLSQAALARIFGVNRNAVTNWEAGLQEPNLDKMPEVVAFVGRGALPACQTLETRIRLQRRAAGLTQTELAGLLGVSRETVNLWESGKRVPKGRHLERVHAFLTVQPG